MKPELILVILSAALLSACGGSNQDRLTDEQASVAAVGPDALTMEDPDAGNELDANAAAAEIPLAEQPEPMVDAEPSKPAIVEGPSFKCEGIMSEAEELVCADPELASLDRRSVSQYSRATAIATSDQRDRLRQISAQYQSDRDVCTDTACVAAAYRNYLRGIDDVMTGRAN